MTLCGPHSRFLWDLLSDAFPWGTPWLLLLQSLSHTLGFIFPSGGLA